MNSIDAEQTVVGGLLINPRVKEVLATGLLPSDFSDKNLGILFQYLVDMDNENAEIDILAVRDWINREENHSGEWTSFPFLATLSDNCVGLANMDIYADHIRKTRINNEIEKLKTDIQY